MKGEEERRSSVFGGDCFGRYSGADSSPLLRDDRGTEGGRELVDLGRTDEIKRGLSND